MVLGRAIVADPRGEYRGSLKLSLSPGYVFFLTHLLCLFFRYSCFYLEKFRYDFDNIRLFRVP